ncbi:MAG: NUDIX hydrolase [Gammaproteobacteria bacterium]
MTSENVPARPSASVVIARDAPAGIEILMLRRNEKIAFHGGAWVFPGGRVDAADAVGTNSDPLEVARRAALRETLEETGLTPSPESLRPFAHWTTPIGLPKRFATWFFLAPVAEEVTVTVDNDEIIDYRWLTPAATLASHAAGELDLPAPTYVTLLGFRAHDSLQALTAAIDAAPVAHFVPRVVAVEGGRCTVYEEDVAYTTLDLELPGPRHRLIMRGNDFSYLREL